MQFGIDKEIQLTKQQKQVSMIPISSGRLRSLTLIAPSWREQERRETKKEKSASDREEKARWGRVVMDYNAPH